MAGDGIGQHIQKLLNGLAGHHFHHGIHIRFDGKLDAGIIPRNLFDLNPQVKIKGRLTVGGIFNGGKGLSINNTQSHLAYAFHFEPAGIGG